MGLHRSGPSRPSDNAEWILLSSVKNEERSKHMLGAVVPKHAQDNPFDKYSPHWADPALDETMTVRGEQVVKRKVLRDTMGALWKSNRDYYRDLPDGEAPSTEQDAQSHEDQPVRLEDILAGRIAAKTKDIRAMVTDLFNFFVRKHEAQEAEIKGGKVRRYEIDNPGGKIRDNLMSCSPWKEQLQKLFDDTYQKKSPYLFVTGLLVCEDLEVRWKRDTSSGYTASATVDGNAILAALHQPPNPELAKHLNSKFNFNQEKSDAQNVFATCKHAVIFAIRYNYLELDFERKPDASHPNWFQRNIQGVARPGIIKSANMSGVVHGKGIMSYANALSEEQRAEDGGDTDDEDDEAEDGDWFYSLTVLESDSGCDDENDDAGSVTSHQNGSAHDPANGSV